MWVGVMEMLFSKLRLQLGVQLKVCHKFSCEQVDFKRDPTIHTAYRQW